MRRLLGTVNKGINVRSSRAHPAADLQPGERWRNPGAPVTSSDYPAATKR
jgi:hypothetical protein